MPDERPNLVLFMPDQLRADAVFGPPGVTANTPNMDALGNQGVTFENTFVQNPACTPSRCSMFTGLYPHVHGHRTMHHLLHAHERNLFQDLRDAGYYVASYGKNDFVTGDAIRNTFDEIDWLVAPENASHGGPGDVDPRLKKAFYNGCLAQQETRTFDWAAVESGKRFLETVSGRPETKEKPFCLFLPVGAPHPPYDVEEPWFSMHDRNAVRPPVAPEFTSPRSFWETARHAQGGNELTEADFREIRATYYGMTSRVDHHLGRILTTLQEQGLWDNTVVAVFADHGDYAGDYGLVEKFNAALHDCLLHVPLILRVPGQQGGTRRQCLVEMVDLYPTLLELAGVEPRHHHFGRSLVPLLDRSAPDTHREFVCAEAGWETYAVKPRKHGGFYGRVSVAYRSNPAHHAPSVMYRTHDWKYVSCPGDRDELYDLEKDPDQTVNLAASPDHSTTLADMRAGLLAWLVQTSDIVPLTEDPRGFYSSKEDVQVHGSHGEKTSLSREHTQA